MGSERVWEVGCPGGGRLDFPSRLDRGVVGSAGRAFPDQVSSPDR